MRVDVNSIAKRIGNGDKVAEEALYSFITDVFRHRAFFRTGRDSLDLLHDTYRIVLVAFRNNALVNPDQAYSFVEATFWNLFCQDVHKRIRFHERGSDKVSQYLIYRKNLGARPWDRKIGIVLTYLNKLSANDRELIVRSIFIGQSKDKICADLKITSGVYRVRKNRAIRRLIERFGNEMQSDAAVEDVYWLSCFLPFGPRSCMYGRK